MLSIIFMLLFSQSLAFDLNFQITKQCENVTLGVKHVTDLTELVGRWYITQYWIKQPPKLNKQQRQLEPEKCPEIYASKTTEEDVENNKRICKDLPETFDLDRVKLKLPAQLQNQLIQRPDGFDILIADGDSDFNYILQTCNYMSRAVFVRLNEDYVLLASPDGGGMLELLSRGIFEEELQCVVDAVDDILSDQGFDTNSYC